MLYYCMGFPYNLLEVYKISFVRKVLGLGSYLIFVSNNFGVIMSKSCIYKSDWYSLSTAFALKPSTRSFF